MRALQTVEEGSAIFPENFCHLFLLREMAWLYVVCVSVLLSVYGGWRLKSDYFFSYSPPYPWRWRLSLDGASPWMAPLPGWCLSLDSASPWIVPLPGLELIYSEAKFRNLPVSLSPVPGLQMPVSVPSILSECWRSKLKPSCLDGKSHLSCPDVASSKV